MNQLSRINSFLIQYHFKNPNLKNLLFEVHKDYQIKLMKEYLKAAIHPLPHEYICTHI